MRAADAKSRLRWKACLPAAAAAAALAVLTVSAGALAEDTVEDPSESADESKKGDDTPSAKKSEEAPAKDAKAEEAGKEDNYGHGQQGSLRVGLMLGYKMDFRYPHSPYCAETYNAAKGPDEQLKTCGFGAPPAMDMALGFAIIDSIEPFVFARFGLTGEERTATNPLFLVGAGVRIYTMSDSRFKLFFEPALAYEGEGASGASTTAPFNPTGFPLEYKKDLVFHLGIGPQYDFAKQFGLYINSGLDVGVLRSISATLLLNIGVQGRLP